MIGRPIHVVCFDIPYPVSHGGFYDLFYKLVALHQQGIQITLHCFEYGRAHQSKLNEFCKAVYYYKRQNYLNSIFLGLPLIVASRRNKTLINNLSKDDFPILLEGTHCTYILYKNLFPGRRIFYRLHNIEHIYYKQLFISEKSIVKKTYYWLESKLLKKYEKIAVQNATKVLAVSQSDVLKFKNYSPGASFQYLPVFLGEQEINNKEGIGTYCLYHGNLSINENEEACIRLIQAVFSKLEIPFIIAGRNPTKNLMDLAAQYHHIQLCANPTESEMKDLIQNAQINLVISYNATGIKLKLINALLYGRYCMVNDAAIEGTGLDPCCIIVSDLIRLGDEIIKFQKKLYLHSYNTIRRELLTTQFNDNVNAQKLIELLY